MKLSSDLKSFEERLGYKFKNSSHLLEAVTHPSTSSPSRRDNQRLEFLGDRVLGLVIAKKLLEIYPEEKEGILDKKYASLVNKKTCLEIAKSINLQNYILIFLTIYVGKKS